MHCEVEPELRTRHPPNQILLTMLKIEDVPQYTCHKVVRAFKIAEFRQPPGLSTAAEYVHAIPQAIGLGAYALSGDFVLKHSPAVGGYIVFYDDDYVSYSPAAAFEKGYSLTAPTPSTRAAKQP